MVTETIVKPSLIGNFTIPKKWSKPMSEVKDDYRVTYSHNRIVIEPMLDENDDLDLKFLDKTEISSDLLEKYNEIKKMNKDDFIDLGEKYANN